VHRHSRQSRLADVGPQGQARIARAVAVVPGQGIAAEVAARYLAGAGVAAVRVKDEATAAAVRAVDPGVRVEVDPGLGEAGDVAALAALSDPATRAVASGALLALRVLRAALATEAS
jgi:molybdopterin/thiamine biosynthesis adenylyltransferase